jgi:hypothetical protein
MNEGRQELDLQRKKKSCWLVVSQTFVSMMRGMTDRRKESDHEHQVVHY